MRFGLSGSGAVGAILLLLLALWPAPVAAQTIKLGAVVPLTGRYGGGGAQVRAGYELAVEAVTAAGGVTRRRQEAATRAADPRRRVRRDQDCVATRDAGLRERRRPPRRLRLRSPRRGSVGGREEQDPVPRRGVRAAPDPPAGVPLSVLAVLEVAGRQGGDHQSRPRNHRRPAPTDRRDLPGAHGLGP